MNGHPYDYDILVEYISPENRGDAPHFSHTSDQAGFTQALREIINHLPESVEDGWEVISHDMTFSRETIILSVLIRRRKDDSLVSL